MEGCTDSTWCGRRYFSCKFHRAYFCPVSNLTADYRGIASSQPANTTPPTYREQAGQPQGSTALAPFNREQRVPEPQGSIPLYVSMGATVQVGNPPRYGVIHWIGSLPGSEEVFAGMGLVRK